MAEYQNHPFQQNQINPDKSLADKLTLEKPQSNQIEHKVDLDYCQQNYICHIKSIELDRINLPDCLVSELRIESS